MPNHNLETLQALDRLKFPPLIDSKRHALFLDLDGTLLELAPRPDLVVVDPALIALLQALSAHLNGALAIVSGRSINDVDTLLPEAVRCVAGLHGQEYRIDGVRAHGPTDAGIEAALVTIRKLKAGGAIDALLENKGTAIALHYRQAPEQGLFVRRMADELASIHGLKVLHGKMVAELVPLNASKALAISTLMREPAFAGRQPVAVGDDVTDEDAFSAALSLGGFAVHVGAARSTHAAYRLESVKAVKSWLRACLGQSLN